VQNGTFIDFIKVLQNPPPPSESGFRTALITYRTPL
jgi:hypothetical protein